MKQVKQIDRTLSSKFSLGLHADLQMRLYAEISKMTPEKILLTAADLAAWKSDVDVESDAARRIMASEQTARLSVKDKERDNIVTALFEEIRQAVQSPIAARAEAGRKLKIVVDTYKGLQWESIAEETSHIEGLLVDLDKCTADLATLGLAPVVELLRTANAEFIAIRTDRALSKAADTLPAGRIIRRKNDETMNTVFRHIEAAYITVATDDDRQAISDLIDRLNRVIRETKTTHNESQAQKKRDGGDMPLEAVSADSPQA